MPPTVRVVTGALRRVARCPHQHPRIAGHRSVAGQVGRARSRDEDQAIIEIETRELEYFVAVAEELHFGRAAERLLIGQPALSKAIRRIEARLGEQLFERTSRHVRLTPSGLALRDHGRSALEAVNLAVRSARRAAEIDVPLRLVLKPDGDADLLPAILDQYAKRPTSRDVEILFGTIADRGRRLREGRADIAILYIPLDDLTDLGYRPLLTLEPVAIVSRQHRLARRQAIEMADLQGETLPRWQGIDTDGDGPEVADATQLAHLVALGRCVAVLPRSAIGPPRSSIVCVPILDAEPSTIVLAWVHTSTSESIIEFVDAAVEAVSRRAPTV
jgi:DNA-binding transcriptional LysR family regulator